MNTKNHKNILSSSIVDIDRLFSSYPSSITINNHDLTLSEVVAVARHNAVVEFTPSEMILKKIQDCYDKMIENICDGVPVYGCNTGYGARASRVLTNGNAEERLAVARKISRGITHVDVSVGPEFDRDIVRAAMLIRINMLMRGVSGIKLSDLEIYRLMLNNFITPVVNQYGGIGASGDLAHNTRVLNAARQYPGVKVIDKHGKVREAKEVLRECNIPQLILDPKAGLGFVNGDNFSTAVASLLAIDTLQSLLISVVLSAMVIEVLKGTDRSFHPMLASVRPHNGQKEVSELMRYLLKGSQLAYQEMKGHQRRPDGIKVQDSYSLRCISQFQAINFEKLKSIIQTISINANSVSDNPLWVSTEFATDGEVPWQWVSGGNFIAMHMVEAIDGLRKTMTQITKLNDRHLSRMVNPHENNSMPANLSDKSAITQCSFKGVQIQSGMFDVYSSLLSIPVSTFFGIHEENNQDITSHALTSGILGLENLRITRYSLAQNLVAVAQAVDLRGGPSYLSPHTRSVYEFIRKKSKYVKEERPLNNDIETMYQTIKNGEMMNILRDKVFNDFRS